MAPLLPPPVLLPGAPGSVVTVRVLPPTPAPFFASTETARTLPASAACRVYDGSVPAVVTTVPPAAAASVVPFSPQATRDLSSVFPVSGLKTYVPLSVSPTDSVPVICRSLISGADVSLTMAPPLPPPVLLPGAPGSVVTVSILPPTPAPFFASTETASTLPASAAFRVYDGRVPAVVTTVPPAAAASVVPFSPQATRDLSSGLPVSGLKAYVPLRVSPTDSVPVIFRSLISGAAVSLTIAPPLPPPVLLPAVPGRVFTVSVFPVISSSLRACTDSSFTLPASLLTRV